MYLNPKTLQAYNLLHEGTLALARAELAGFRVDLEYIERKKILIIRKYKGQKISLRKLTFINIGNIPQKEE